MAEAHILLAFLVSASAIAFLPGPSVAYAVARTTAAGRAAGLRAAGYLFVAGFVHVAAAAFGLGALLAHAPAIYTAIKLLGAAYLVYLGVTIVLAALRGDHALHGGGAAPAEAKGERRAFLEAVLVIALTPKALIFFYAFLLHFVASPSHLSATAQLVVLGTVVNLLFLAASVLYVAGVDAVTRRAGGPAAGVRLGQGAAGLPLVALGAWLALGRD